MWTILFMRVLIEESPERAALRKVQCDRGRFWPAMKTARLSLLHSIHQMDMEAQLVRGTNFTFHLLALAYRVIAHFGGDDLVFTHTSSRVHDPDL